VASVGYWLYLGAQPVVHLVQRPPGAGAAVGSSAIDHVAFHGTDLESCRRRLQTEGIPFREAVIPRDQSVQLFVHDPDGIKVELNFDPPLG
jgi:catechol 2,3-dioxygenase-like lactoylglutathione lyase family enzyme